MPEREPIQHPISKLGFFTEHTTSWLDDVNEAAATAEEARKRPHVLTDGDVARIRSVYTHRGEDLALFEDTAARWSAQEDLTAAQRTGRDALEDNLTRLRERNTSVQELARYLETRTLNKVLATPDMELGLNTLLAQMNHAQH